MAKSLVILPFIVHCEELVKKIQHSSHYLYEKVSKNLTALPIDWFRISIRFLLKRSN